MSTTHEPIRAALLGSGLFATGAYLPSLQEVPGIHIQAVWSRSEKGARTLEDKAKSLGFPALEARFGDAGLETTLKEESINAVILVLPITAQPDIIRRAWKAGKHVISEKPIGRDVKEAKELIAEYENEFKPKGLIWRVAENWAHEPMLHEAASLLRNPDLGPVLYWKMHFEASIIDGTAWHATTWRTIPQYQGGFILDGGVHWAAMLRTVLPEADRPASVIAVKSLHRSHILPHDTVSGIVRPAASAIREPTGKPTQIKAEIEAKDMPVKPGKSSADGTFLWTWAAPETPKGVRAPNEFYIVAENGMMRILNQGPKWEITLTPGEGSKVEAKSLQGAATGVEVELADFARAVAANRDGMVDDSPNNGDPRTALWDLQFVQAALNSEGMEENIA